MNRTAFIIRGARPVYDKVAELDRKLEANRRERTRLLGERREAAKGLADCTIEFPDGATSRLERP